MRVANLKIANGGEFFITGSTPLLIIAKTVEIDGVIDASAHLNGLQPGPGGGRPGMRDPGEGGLGVVGPQNNNTGGGGGGFATAGGDGGAVECAAQVQGGGGGVAHGDPQLTVLRGGGAGGSGGPRCPTITERGGFGGGALQISATESITISGTGKVRASGGGGNFGSGDCSLRDDAGSGGGAGGAIYLDAPHIGNEGVVEAFGGGGGGGGDDAMPSGNAGDGNRGHWGNEFMIVAPAVTLLPSVGGAGQPSKGTNGGNGARTTAAAPGAVGDCANTLQPFFNTGGGGGAAGRIVVRTRGEVSPFGTIEPPPTKLDYVVP
jgi:hypothetical protein